MAGSGIAHLRDSPALLRAEHLVVEYPAGPAGGVVHAVSDLSIDILRGETLGLVGESGCGKSTTGRALLQMPRPTSGRVSYAGVELTALGGRALRPQRRRLQMIFQDPISALNPRRTILELVAEPLRVWNVADRREIERRVAGVLERVGLDPDVVARRRPHELSGGQCQRVCIARALILEPDVIVCDEPVSALDVSVQAQILNLIEDLKAEHDLTLVFIAHDLAVVKRISDRIAVMYLGKLCEVGAVEPIYRHPAHPYTRALLAAIPAPDPNVRPDVGHLLVTSELPSPLAPPSGCRFRTRCPRADARCADEEPQMHAVGDDHFVACHHPLEPGGAEPHQLEPHQLEPHQLEPRRPEVPA